MIRPIINELSQWIKFQGVIKMIIYRSSRQHLIKYKCISIKGSYLLKSYNCWKLIYDTIYFIN